MGELNVYRQLGIKPNFTQIGRRYGLHRQTVAKYWRRGGRGGRSRRRCAPARLGRWRAEETVRFLSLTDGGGRYNNDRKYG